MVIIGSKSVHTRDSSVFPDTADCKPKLENRKFKEYQQTNPKLTAQQKYLYCVCEV